MTPDQQPAAGLDPEFLDDFYAECDEHLTTIREGLVSLESSIGAEHPDVDVIQRLFRAFHSVKGNSGIIGLRAAEELAHATEDFLRELGRGERVLTQGTLDLLMGASQGVEQVVAASRRGQPSPDLGALLQSLHKAHGGNMEAASIPPAHPPASPKPEADPQAAAEARGLSLWTFSFSPTKDLDAQGININSIRTRLSEIGQILKATPDVKDAGRVTFNFLVSLAAAPEDLDEWEQAGVLVAPFEEPKAPVTTALKDSGASSAGSFVAPSHVLRVDLNRLDELMRITGELVIQRARLEDQIARAATKKDVLNPQSLQEINVAMGRALREMRETVMSIRLVTVAEIFSRMPFVVRDLARETGKKVRLSISGQQTEIDKYLVERLKDPLLHLVRNSISHGIETTAEREAAGKPAEATIFLHATALSDTVIIEVGDDGRGIDIKAVRERAREAGLPVPAPDNNNALLAVLCAPGFSTREAADRASGRGMGMAAVQTVINALGGTLSLESEPGRGVRFRLRLPLTLAIADVFIASIGAQTCAVPQSFVEEIILATQDSVRLMNGTEFIPWRNGILPLLRLQKLFGLEPLPRATFPVMVISSEAGSVGLGVERIHGQREVVVRPLQDPLVQEGMIAGATELGDGRPVLILNAASLTASAVRLHEGGNPGTPSAMALPIAV